MTGVRAWRLALGVAGVAAVLFGLRGLLTGGPATDWPVTATWLLAGVLVHDLVVVPVVAGVGWLLARWLPEGVRPVVRGGLVVAATVTVVALPVLNAPGDPRNPSLMPLDYPRNLAVVLGVVGAVTVVLAVHRRWRAGRAAGPRAGAG